MRSKKGFPEILQLQDGCEIVYLTKNSSVDNGDVVSSQLQIRFIKTIESYQIQRGQGKCDVAFIQVLHGYFGLTGVIFAFCLLFSSVNVFL